MGATGHPLVQTDSTWAGDTSAARHSVVVVGAHLSGQPLNHQLVGLGGTLVRATLTAPNYRLYALGGTVPPKPGLVRVRDGGRAIEVEVWSLDTRSFGAFVSAIARPLCIGTIELEGGTFAQGFLCENDAVVDAIDISEHGGWRGYLTQQNAISR
jgi:allophanate hydrolase